MILDYKRVKWSIEDWTPQKYWVINQLNGPMRLHFQEDAGHMPLVKAKEYFDNREF
ncbi:hypothetical protein [Bacillus salacetis]|uniref:hypothetical protein n=1 Tax=Bacillus salacetis TaxID=2315464 RepID=UPI0014441569|nr:hypothetical protein [Bacillus salacetis]